MICWYWGSYTFYSASLNCEEEIITCDFIPHPLPQKKPTTTTKQSKTINTGMRKNARVQISVKPGMMIDSDELCGLITVLGSDIHSRSQDCRSLKCWLTLGCLKTDFRKILFSAPWFVF